MALLALVQLDDLFSIDGKTFVGVDHHAEKARVGLQKRDSMRPLLCLSQISV